MERERLGSKASILGVVHNKLVSWLDFCKLWSIYIVPT